MSATSLLYNLLVLCSAILASCLAAYAIARDNRIFMLFTLAIAEWSFSYVFANFAPDPATRLFWLAAADIGVAFSGPLWLLFALANTGRMEVIPPGARAAIWLMGALSLALLLTNGAIGVLNTGVAAVASGAVDLHGPLFWLHTLVAYSAILAGLVVMARTALGAGSPYRERARLLLAGALVPLLTNIAYLAMLFGRSNTADVTPIALVATSVAFSYAMRRHQMLTLRPIARQVVLDSMSDGLIVVDPAGQIVEYNPAAAAIAQLRPGAVGRQLPDALPDRELGRALQALAAARSGAERIVTLQALSQRSIQVTCTPLSGAKAPVLGVLLLLRDITRQTLAEAALAQQAADLTTLHHVASAIGTTIEPRTLLPAVVNETRAALGVSYAAVGLIDAGSRLVITTESTQSGAIALAGRSFTLSASSLASTWRRGEPIMIADPQNHPHLAEVRGLLAAHHIQSMMIIPLRTNDLPIGALCVASSASAAFDQARLNLAQMIAGYVAAAIANAQLFEASQQAVRTKSAILDTISHEFRTPITAILGFTELYQEHVLGPVTAEQAEALNAVHRNAHRLLKLVDDMLDMARLAAGNLELALHTVDIELCVKEATTMVEAQSSGLPFQVALDIAADLPLAHANTTWLRRALVHLISYALGTSPGRQITIHALTDPPNAASSPDIRLLIEIDDHGAVLADAERAVLFDAFQQLPNSSSDLTLSSIARLGLAISKRAIEQMNGDLSMTSRPGRGNTFVITLRQASDQH